MTRGLSCFIALLLMASFVSSLGAGPSHPVPALGQVSGREVYLNGVQVPPGATLLSRGTVTTGKHLATVHLKNGRVIQLARNSAASFREVSIDEIRVAVTSGAIRFRGTNGEIRALEEAGAVLFKAGREALPSRGFSGLSVVTTLRDQAEKGQQVLLLVDGSSVSRSRPLFLRAAPGDPTSSYDVAHVDPGQGKVLLVRELEMAYPAGAEVLLQTSSRSPEGTTAQHTGGRVSPPPKWWESPWVWVAGLGATAATVVVTVDDGSLITDFPAASPTEPDRDGQE